MTRMTFTIRCDADRESTAEIVRTLKDGMRVEITSGGAVYGRGRYDRHGGTKTRAYSVWSGMIQRCCNPNDNAFSNYGGRGLTVSEDWMKFSNFLADMGEPPPGMSLERKDNNSGYSEENCIWADRTTQGRNKRNNVLLTVDGETLPLSAIADRYGIRVNTVRARLKKGWSDEDAVKLPLVKDRVGIPKGMPIHRSSSGLISFNGQEMTLRSAARKTGISYATIYNRVRKGWSLHDAISEPARRGPHKKREGYPQPLGGGA